MGGDQTQIINTPWRDYHDEYLRISAGDDLAIIKEQVQNGIAQLWHCTCGDKQAYFVTRIDQTGSGPELCIVLGEGSGGLLFAQRFVEFARRNNMPIRTHVKRPGLIRMWSRLGVNVDEFVLRG